jgi:DNA-binding LacI/PurR family transcriptional regulator
MDQDKEKPPKKNSKASIKEVARLANVSTATVSRVINNKGAIAKETYDRVWVTIREVNYVPQAAAKRLRIQKTQTIGFLVGELSAPFQLDLLRGIEALSRELGYSLLVQSTSTGTSEHYHRLIGEQNTDGLLILVGAIPEQEIRSLYEKEFPIVLLCQSPPHRLHISHIVFENKRGARKIVDHLIEIHHHRRIAFLRGPVEIQDSHWREEGYCESLETHQLAIDPAIIGMGEFDEKITQSVVSRWLKENAEIDAIFAGDDESAIGAVLAVREAGKRVPEDIAVVGFDDSYFTYAHVPPLTTVHCPIEEMGRKAVQQLDQLIQDHKAYSRILLPTELIVRCSCGCNNAELDWSAQ